MKRLALFLVIGSIVWGVRGVSAAPALPPPPSCDLGKTGYWIGLPGDERIDLHFFLAADRSVQSPLDLTCGPDGSLIEPAFKIDFFTENGKMFERTAERYRYTEDCGAHHAIELPGDRAWMIAFPDLGKPWQRIDEAQKQNVLLDDWWDMVEGSFRLRESTLGAHDGKVVYREVRRLSPGSDVMAVSMVLEYPPTDDDSSKQYSGVTVFLNPEKKDLNYLVNSRRYAVSLQTYAHGDDVAEAIPFLGQYSNGDLVVMLLGDHQRPTVVSLTPQGNFLSDEPDSVEECD